MQESFAPQLRDLGLEPGDIVLMHSSMKALGATMTPEAFLREILTVLGPQGTLLLPALSYMNVTAQQPVFSVRESEPCVGLLPRTFFRMEGVVRSLHPTHSVCAYGKMAKELTARHILDDTPVGSHSPFMQLKAHGGKLLFVGDVLACCTFMHGIEEMANTPYTLSEGRTRYIIEDYDGNRTPRDMITHDFKGWEQEYERVRDVLAYPDIRTGKVGKANCTLIDAAALARAALAKLGEDLYYFVSKSNA